MTVQKFLMSNLAFADLSLGLYLLLIAAIDVHSMGEYFNFGYDWQYGKPAIFGTCCRDSARFHEIDYALCFGVMMLIEF